MIPEAYKENKNWRSVLIGIGRSTALSGAEKNDIGRKFLAAVRDARVRPNCTTIGCAFTWDAQPEGYTYWCNAARKVGDCTKYLAEVKGDFALESTSRAEVRRSVLDRIKV
jgi:hypothetical protein